MTTIDSITDTDIQTLRAEAGAAGDSEQVTICDLAINGDAFARAECVAVINAAEVMDDDEDNDESCGDTYIIALDEDEAWAAEAMDDLLDERFTVRPAYPGVCAGRYKVYPNGDRQILGYSIPCPDDIHEMIEAAWLGACS